MLLFQGAGARIPNEIAVAGHGRVLLTEPLAEAVWPIWKGQEPLPDWKYGERFCRNLVSLAAPTFVAQLGRRWKPLQFLPLVVAQILAMTILRRYARLVDDPRGVRLDAGGSMDRSRNRNPDPDPELHLDASSSTGSPSQNRIVPSTLAETSVIPSGKNATSLTRWEWPRKLPTFR